MRVAWLADDPGYTGGAELTQSEFAAAAPKGVEVVRVNPKGVELLHHFDAICVFNCVSYPAETIQGLKGRKVVRYWNDICPHGDPELRAWLVQHATNVFCSPLHAERFPAGPSDGHVLIPPPVNLQPFRDAAASVNGDRGGAVSVATWVNPAKGAHLVNEWSQRNKTPVSFYGFGALAPAGATPVAYGDMPALLARHERFVFLPTDLEPFGRLVAEADAAGCEVVTNHLVGARYWLEHDRAALDTAAEDFWSLVTA